MKKFFKILIIFLCVIFSTSFLVNAFSLDKETEVDFSQVKMACLGDSITLGARVNNPFPSLLKDELGLKSCYNYGVSGAEISYSDAYTSFCDNYLDMPKKLDIIMVMVVLVQYVQLYAYHQVF